MKNNIIINTTGQVIQEMRIRAGLTQQALANALNVTDKAVSKWERGICLPDTMLLPKLALILDIDLDILISMSINVNEWVGLIDIKDIDLINQEEFLCHMWSKEYQNKEKELQINDYIKQLYRDCDNIFYISTNDRLKLNNLVLIKEFMTNSNALVADEKYKLYKIVN